MRTIVAVMLTVTMLTGCSTYAASRYSISADNVRTLREYRGQTVNVGAFTAAESETEIMCRGVGPIKTPDGESFELFVRKAFIDELTIAEVFSPNAPITLTGRLDGIDGSQAHQLLIERHGRRSFAQIVPRFLGPSDWHHAARSRSEPERLGCCQSLRGTALS
jgi:hypothetical protein